MTIYQKAIQLLKESNTLTLSIVDEKGSLKIYPLEKVSSVNLNEIIFITKKNSIKFRSLKISNKCCVEVHSEDDMICIRGNIEIEENEKKMKQILSSEYIQRLESRGDLYILCIDFSCF